MKYFAIIENGMVTGVIEGDAPENQEFIELDQESIEPKSNCIIVLEGKKVVWKADAKLVREKRNQLLKDSDWRILKCLELGMSHEPWVQYRQALRNLPQTPGFPEVAFPVMPDV